MEMTVDKDMEIDFMQNLVEIVKRLNEKLKSLCIKDCFGELYKWFRVKAAANVES